MIVIPAIQSTSLTRKAALRIDHGRVVKHVTSLLPHLSGKKKILDLGCGFCSISHELMEKGFDVTPVDIKNASLYAHITPRLYDGNTLPFPDKYFDAAILVTVLHHIPDPLRVLREVKRVAREIIIIEDTYDNETQKYATYVMDCLTNMEFFGHPHTNRSDEGWEKAFKNLDMTLMNKKNGSFWSIFKSSLFHVKA